MHEVTQKEVFLNESVVSAEKTPADVQPAAPRKTLGLHPGPKRLSLDESIETLFVKYDRTMRVLAGLEDSPVG